MFYIAAKNTFREFLMSLRKETKVTEAALPSFFMFLEGDLMAWTAIICLTALWETLK